MASLGRVHCSRIGRRTLSSLGRSARGERDGGIVILPIRSEKKIHAPGLCNQKATSFSDHLSNSIQQPRLGGVVRVGLPYITCCHLHVQVGSAQAVRKEAKAESKGQADKEHGSVLMQFVEKEQEPKALTVGAKVVEAGKDATSIFVIIGGFAVAGYLLWSIGSEFFSSASPQTIYSKALKRVKSDARVIEALGEPIAGHGDTSGRGRRRNIAHQEYVVDDVPYMRMKFYVDGSQRKGVVHLDLKKNPQGKYECRFLFVELQGHPRATIVIEDNR